MAKRSGARGAALSDRAWLLRLAWRQRWPLALTVGAAAVGAVGLIWQSATLTSLIDGAFLQHRSLAALASFAGLLAALVIGRALAVWLGAGAAQAISAGARQTLRLRLFRRVAARGPLSLTHERSGELAHTLVNGVEEVDGYLSQYAPQIILSLLVPGLILLVVFPLDPISGLTLLATAPLIPVFGALIGSTTEQVTRNQWGLLSRLNAHFLDVLQGVTTLKLFGRSARQADVIAQVSERYRRATMRTLRLAFLSGLALELVATLSVAIVAVEVGLRLLYGSLSFPHAFLTLLLAPEFYLPLRALGAKYHAAASGVAAAERMRAILADPEPAQAGFVAESPKRREFIRPPSPQNAPSPTPPLTIAAHEVSYTYPGASQPALDRVSFMLPEGARVAIVGPSGSGKSTLAALLLRFAEPDAGELLVNGVSLGAIDARAWRENIAWVPQRPRLFHEAVAENIRLGRMTASDADVQRAAQQAGIDGFICTLPLGYATVVGEDGARLSGGQAQRIALARAFLRDAPILLLDEPTAQLDAALDATITQTIHQQPRDRLTIVIAHRLRTILDADLILVMERGQIVASGTHARLLASSPLYRELVKASGWQEVAV